MPVRGTGRRGAALGLFGIVWGGSWRVPGYVIVAGEEE
jgi:hypothetical protein